MKFILGKKIGMTQVFLDNGTVVPVTRIQAGPCVVTQVKTKENDGVEAVQFGFDTQKTFRVSKPQRGHLEGLSWEPGVSVRFMREVPMDTKNLKRGDVYTAATFAVGDKVSVIGNSKGRGFQGVVKRHGFAGGPASHGHKDNLRMPGSIGAGGVQRVFKGMRMGGHMGDAQITVKNLEVVVVKAEENELWVKGAIPGARNGLVFVTTSSGDVVVERSITDAEVKAEVVEEKMEVAETPAEVTEETTQAEEPAVETAAPATEGEAPVEETNK